MKRHERKSPVVERLGACLPRATNDLLVVPAKSPLGRNQRPHAGSTDSVNRDSDLVKSAENTDVRQTAREASAQREAKSPSGQETGQSLVIRCGATSYMIMPLH